MTRQLVVAIAAVFVTASPAFAQGPGTISGTVVDALTNAPLAHSGSSDMLVWLTDGSGALIATQTTVEAGQYAFTGLAPGTYHVKVTTVLTNYVSELYDDLQCVGNDCAASAGTPLTLAAGATLQANFALSLGGGFSGTVRRQSDSSPVQGATVLVYNANTSLIRNLTTDANGAYSISGLPTGSYFARVVSGVAPVTGLVGQLYGGPVCVPIPATPDFGCRIASGTPIQVVANSTTVGIDFSLIAAGSITGRVVQDGSGQPLAGEFVELYAGEQRVSLAPTDADGRYVLSNVPAGFYSVRTATVSNFIDEWFGGPCVGCPGTPGGLTVGVGEFSGVDFSLAPGARIRGMIDCSNTEPTLVPAIYVYNASGSLVHQLESPSGCGVGIAPQPYEISGLPPGQYYLVARDRPFIPFGIRLSGGILVDQLYSGTACVTVDCDPRRGLPVSVSAGGITDGIAFHMLEGASSHVPGLSGADGRVLRLYDSRGAEVTNIVRSTFIGRLQQIVGVPPGTYYATFGDRLHGRGLCVNCPPTAGKPIVIQPGQLAFALAFDLAATTTISGTVRNEAGGAPLSTITVEAFSDSGVLVGSAVTDVAGRYTLFTGGPGTYFLRTSNDRGFVDEAYPDAPCPSCDLRSGAPVVVAASNLIGVDFTLAGGGLVSGRVFNTNMNVLAGVPISLLTPAASLVGRTTTFADGRFRVTLPAGTYRARAEATARHGAQIFMEQPCTSVACDVSAGTPIVVTTGGDRTNVAFLLPVCSAMTLSPGLLASGVDGRPYRQVFTVSGGSSPMLFAVTSGVLPEGLSLSPSGILAGTPTSAGRHAFSVSALDAAGCATSRAMTLDVQGCAFILSPASASIASAGGDVTVTITDSCSPQTVDTAGTFVTVQSNAPGQVVLTVPPNTGGASRSATVTIGRRAFVINQGGLAPQPPFGSVDAPADGAQVSGSVAVGGWALDDLEVRRVRIYRDPVGGEPGAQVFLGDAVFVSGARPDVRAAYPTFPLNDRAGWGFLILTNMLPNQGNGVFRVYAYAEDTEGLQTLLGARTIIGVNSSSALPFGAIDMPAQGATIAGTSYINFGWALTPQPKIIPTDGSTIAVLIDGLSIGSPSYNHLRSDIAALFPGLANSNGAVGYRILDTTALAEGQHTLAWIVSDNQGATAGIGSRYFSVANSADAQPQAGSGVESGQRSESLASTPAAAPPLRNVTHELRQLPREDGTPHVTLRAMERLELQLAELEPEGRCAPSWAAYQVEDKTLGRLPVGASIDRSGTFYWQPGPGFKGRFDLMFVRTACDGSKQQTSVTVVIDGL